MTETKLDFDLPTDEQGNFILHESLVEKGFYYFITKKIKQVCQAVDAINERLDKLEDNDFEDNCWKGDE